eukprot:scaffold73411_cov31-Tisochrysis_lutea.AAC.1
MDNMRRAPSQFGQYDGEECDEAYVKATKYAYTVNASSGRESCSRVLSAALHGSSEEGANLQTRSRAQRVFTLCKEKPFNILTSDGARSPISPPPQPALRRLPRALLRGSGRGGGSRAGRRPPVPGGSFPYFLPCRCRWVAGSCLFNVAASLGGSGGGVGHQLSSVVINDRVMEHASLPPPHLGLPRLADRPRHNGRCADAAPSSQGHPPA